MSLTFKEVRKLFQVPSHGRVRLRDYDPGWAADEEFQELTKDELKARAAAFLEQNIADLAKAQERLYASDTHSVLIVLQASDAAGKDDEAVGFVEQGLFSLVHVVGVAVLDAVEHAFEFAEGMGHDAEHLAAGVAGVGGDLAHQTDIAAAIDGAPAARGDRLAELLGEMDVAGVGSRGGAAVDSDGRNSGHSSSLFSCPA